LAAFEGSASEGRLVSSKRPNVEPSGWYFEFANDFYPDIDDTAMVLLSLLHAKLRTRQPRSHARSARLRG
jgi:squalene-hopene/tetraprenyl-beta-curcumene cyclase